MNARILVSIVFLVLIVGLIAIDGSAYAETGSAPLVGPPTPSPTADHAAELVLGAEHSTSQTLATATMASSAWTKYSGNPILENGPAGSWDASNVELASVLKQGDTYKLWYTGDAGTSASGRIGYATSSDGVNWSKPVATPVLSVGAPGTWDSGYVAAPEVIFHDGTYHMWYRGTNKPNDPVGAGIGYATSSDGINWTKHPSNPVLAVGPAGSWDSNRIWSVSVVVTDGQFKMWYGASNGVSYRIGYATSSDGVTWTKHSGNPVLNLGAGGSWDSNRVYYPSVVATECAYEMWYSGYNGTRFRIGHATSANGTQWNKDPDNPVLTSGAGDSWDSALIIAPEVRAIDDDTYGMWYTGQDAGGTFRIGYATAPDENECPSVQSTSPANNATDVPIDEPVQVVFTKAMNTSTVVLRDGDGTVLPYTPTWSAGDTTVTYDHPLFDSGETVTLSISGQDKDGRALVAGTVPSTWSFTVVNNPYVKSTSPVDGAGYVRRDEPIEIVFSKPMNKSTVELSDGSARPYTPTWSADDTRVTYDHPDYAYNETVTLSVSGQDKSGNALIAGTVPSTWSFKVTDDKPYVQWTDPEHGATDVPVDAQIEIVFSKPMSTSTVVLSDSIGRSYTPTWSAGNTEVRYDHADFPHGAEVSLSITGQDLSGNTLSAGDAPTAWTFSVVGRLSYLPIIMR